MKIKTNIFFIVFLFTTITTYSQIDSLNNRIIYNWKLNPYDLSQELVELDTSLASFQNFNSLLKKTITCNYLGNLGTAAQSNIYYDRSKFKTGFIFSEPYGIYFHMPKEQLYYNTKKPFTLFNYSSGGPKDESEQVLGILHTQNVNKDFNFGFKYDLISSDGRYQYQQVKQNKITVFSSYQKKGYHLHTNFGLNRVKAQENGGIDSLFYLGDKDYKNRKNIPVKLEDAGTNVFNTNFYLAQEYRFGKSVKEEVVIVNNEKKQGPPLPSMGKSIKGPKGNVHIVDQKHNNNKGFNKSDHPNDKETQSDGFDADSSMQANQNVGDTIDVNVNKDTISVFKVSGFSLSHEMTYNKDIRKFYDEGLDTTYYKKLDIFIDSLNTSDKVNQKQFANKLSLHYKYMDKFSSSLSFYDERMTYIYNIKPDTTFSDKLIDPIQDTIIKSNVEKTYSNGNVSFYTKAVLFNHILFKGYGEYYLYGYKAKDTKVNLNLGYIIGKNTRIDFAGKYNNSRPNYFYENFSSNNFKWQNNLDNIKVLDFGFFITNSKYKFSTKAYYRQISNYVFLDSTAYVQQYTDKINIISAEISKKLKLGLINSVTRFVYQQSSNDSILSLPAYNLYQSLYFERLIKFPSTGGELLLQAGVDYRYTSSYMADGYMPVSGLFYRQYNHKQENYHRFDVFVNITIKRARFYFKYDYLNSAINKYYYFTGPYYPSPEPLFKFGVAWTFYD